MISAEAKSPMDTTDSHRNRHNDRMVDENASAEQGYFHDELLDEFLDGHVYDDPAQITNELLSTGQDASTSSRQMSNLQQQLLAKSPRFAVHENEGNSMAGMSAVAFDPVYTMIDFNAQNNDLQRYKKAKDELMNLKFGGSAADYNVCPQPANGAIPTDSEQCRSMVPSEYLSGCDRSQLPYHMNISDLPTSSRVETQIKLKLTISPPPPQFLIHFPRDTIAKPKLTLEDSEIPESIRPNMLYLDTFIVGSSATEDSSSMQSYNICRRCMRREIKRASRRKSGLLDETSGWSINRVRRALIFNCKEVVSFPQPTGNASQLSERSMSILTRIVCYCRHHQENKGFKLFFVLKDYTGRVVAKTLSGPIMIMDRKKSPKSGHKSSVTDSEVASSALSESSASNAISTDAPKAAASKVATPAAPAIKNSKDAFTEGTSTFSSFASGKQRWSPSSTSPSTYFDTSSQFGTRKTSSISSSTSVKKEPISPLSSDTLSPQNNFYSSSATSVFSTTPDKNTAAAAAAAAAAISQCADPAAMSAPAPQLRQQQVTPAVNPQAQSANTSDPLKPSIERIIPAQGPIRGGVEITILGTNFQQGMGVKFGANLSLATHCWSSSTLVTYLPPATQAGPVLVTIQNPVTGEMADMIPSSHQIFTYTDDSDRQLIELALQIVGLKMNGKLEDAKNIARRIIGSNHDGNVGGDGSNDVEMCDAEMDTSTASSNWFDEASDRMKQFSNIAPMSHEEILVKFLSLLDLPNSPVVSPNWGLCTLEGQTMLHLASMKGYFGLSRYLVEHGAKVDSRDANKLTPLCYALIHGHRDIIRLLIRCKASTSMVIGEGISLKDIADPNVLDLLDFSCGSSEDNSIFEESLSREQSVDSLSSLIDDSAHRIMRANGGPSTTRRRYIKGAHIRSDTESEADSEDNTDYSISEESIDVNNNGTSNTDTTKSDSKISRKSRSRTIGLQFWMAMRGAFGVKDSRDAATSSDDAATMTVADETVTLVDERENENATVVGDSAPDDDILPSYDDLFPNGGNWRSFINFRGHDEKRPEQTAGVDGVVSASSESDSETKQEAVEDAIISLKSKHRLNSDKRLMFFWIPFLLVLLLIVVGSHLNLVKLDEFQYASKAVEDARDYFGSIMLGRDRFARLLNENWSLGRERMNKVFNDMNAAMMTAVGGAR